MSFLNINALNKNSSTYNKIDLKFVSIDQDPYQCKVLTTISYLPFIKTRDWL